MTNTGHTYTLILFEQERKKNDILSSQDVFIFTGIEDRNANDKDLLDCYVEN